MVNVSRAFISNKRNVIQELFCSLFVTILFSLRWRSCLPLSGHMPVFNDWDNLGIFGRYLVYAKESFHFPVGLIENLGFPFSNTNLAKASLPIFAFMFKLLSRVYEPFSEFYYIVSVELVGMFLTGLFTCLLLRSLGVTNFYIKFMGTVLIALSHPVLFRSSEYYGITYVFLNSAMYMAFFYLMVNLYKKTML